MSSRPLPPDAPLNQRGIALVSALLIVMVVAVVAAGFIFIAGGERSVSSNVTIARASLLAADAGVRVTQQMLANSAKTQLDNLALNWVSGPIITSPSTLFPTGPQTFSGTSPQFSTTATISFADSDLTPEAQTFNYRYVITSTGNSGAQGMRQVQSTGILRVSASRGSFADYLCFTHVHTTPAGDPIWFTSSSHFDGRVHTNGEFRFAFQPFFQDLASSVNAKSIFFNNGATQVEKIGASNGTMDVPLFYGGFQQGAALIPFPANTYEQQTAALGPSVPAGVAPSLTQINTALGLGAVASTPPNGVYLVTVPSGGLPGTAGSVSGGIYVQGSLDQFLMVADTVAHTQSYSFTQGGTSRTITIDRTANTTTVQSGASSSVYTGVPRGSTFINGSILDLRGPDRVFGVAPPAIAKGTEMLITATGDIVLQRDLTCENFTEATNVLGIYSSQGSVRIGSGAPDDMSLDAFVMATGASSDFDVDSYNSGAPRGAFHLRGGVVERYFGAFFTFDTNGDIQHGYWRDFHYDRRGLIPPYYPKTNRYFADQPTARTLAWKEI